jgi:hypothetical protein
MWQFRHARDVKNSKTVNSAANALRQVGTGASHHRVAPVATTLKSH